MFNEGLTHTSTSYPSPQREGRYMVRKLQIWLFKIIFATADKVLEQRYFQSVKKWPHFIRFLMCLNGVKKNGKLRRGDPKEIAHFLAI